MVVVGFGVLVDESEIELLEATVVDEISVIAVVDDDELLDEIGAVLLCVVCILVVLLEGTVVVTNVTEVVPVVVVIMVEVSGELSVVVTVT